MNLKNLVRLINKVTWFDRILIFLIVSSGLVFFIFFYRKAEYVTIRVKVTEQEVLYAYSLPKSWYANRFEIGDQELDTLGRPSAEIIGIERFNTDSSHKVVYLDLRVRAVYDTRTKLYSARGRNLIFGAPIRLNLSKIVFDGIVTEFPGSERQVKTELVEIDALARSVEPAMANFIKKGEQIFDSNGILLAQTAEVEIKPAEQVTQTAAGELLLRANPLYKDVRLKLLVRTKEVFNELFMFDDVPVKVGEIIPLNFEKLSLFPIVTAFSDRNDN